MSFNKLKGVSNIGDFGPSETLAENVIRFFDWGFVNAGGFFNVTIPASSIYGGSQETLTWRRQPNFSNGQVWEAGRRNWVWETGVDGDTQPIAISGVYVDGNFYSKDTTGAYAHYYDYINGQVIFESGISTSSTVQLEYSYKYVTVVDAYTVPYFQRLQDNGFTFTGDLVGSGDMLLSGEARLQMPVVAVEVAPMADSQGYEIGHGSRKVMNTIRCHIVTNSPNINRRLGDIIVDQSDKTILMYNLNTVIASGGYPLDSRGMVASGALNYPEMVTTYYGNKARFMDGSNNQQITEINRRTHVSVARLSSQVILNVV